jgi:hypothetical protein
MKFVPYNVDITKLQNYMSQRYDVVKVFIAGELELCVFSPIET